MKRREFLTTISTLPVAVGVRAAYIEEQQRTVSPEQTDRPIAVGSDRQLFLDDFFFARQQNIRLTLHRPQPRNVVVTCDRPWEKDLLHYTSVLREDDRFRMWYRVDDTSANRSLICYAESRDGIHWDKPNLGLVPWKGSRQNNIIFPSNTVPGGNCSVILDPMASADARYKMLSARSTQELWAYVSADGLAWRPSGTKPVLGPPAHWGFDSHNVLLWDDTRQRYVIYCRGWMNTKGVVLKPDTPEARNLDLPNMFRVIRRSESADFRSWSEPRVVVMADEHDPPGLDFYTNACVKYERAARAWFIFSMTLSRGRHFPGAPHPGLSDLQFLSSRDGIRWDRRFRGSYIRHGLDQRNWVDRNPIVGIGLLPTGESELSIYYSEFLRSPQTRLRRATIRTDGFVSIDGPYIGWGEFTTHPLIFSGRRLALNSRTSGGGTILVELQDENGNPLPGFTLEDSPTIFGDQIEGLVSWKENRDLSELSGRPIRMRVKLRDAELFAFRFRS